jgi:hypothetical protein
MTDQNENGMRDSREARGRASLPVAVVFWVSEANETQQPRNSETGVKIMRAFLMSAVLIVAALTVGATSVQAYDYVVIGPYRHHYRPEIVIRPAPVLIAPAPVLVTPQSVVVAQPTVIVPAYQPAPYIVGPVIRPAFSIRIGIR